MKIARVEAHLLSCPLPKPLELPFYGGLRTILKRDAMLIRIVADNGLVGYAPGPAHERAARQIKETIGPFLQGRDPSRMAGWTEAETYKIASVLICTMGIVGLPVTMLLAWLFPFK